MNKSTLFKSVLVLCLTITFGQAVLASQVIKSSFEVPAGESQYEYTSPVYKTKGVFSGLIAEWDQKDDHGHATNIFIRVKKDDQTFGKWLPIQADIDHSKEELSYKDALVNVPDANGYQYRVTLYDDHDYIDGLKFTFINVPEPKTKKLASTRLVAGNEISGFIPVITRDQWGAIDEYNYLDDNDDTDVDVDTNADSGSDAGRANDLDEQDEANEDIENVIYEEDGRRLAWPLQYAKDIRFMAVHHTVSGSDDPEQTLRNIQYFHAVRRGWGDIGYNYIVDQEGRIYEGRKGGEKVIGGHSIPINKTSIGVAVLGNFQVERPPKEVLEALARIIKSKSELYDLDPLKTDTYKGKTYPVVGGHRDSDSTACPGEFLYQSLPAVKQLVARSMNTLHADGDIVDTEPLREIIDLKPQEQERLTIKLENNSGTTWDKDQTYLAFFETEKFQNSIKFPGASPDYKVATIKNRTDVKDGDEAEFVLNIEGGFQSQFVSLNLVPVINRKIKKENLIFVPVYISGTEFSYKLDGKTTYDLDLEPGETEKIKFDLENTGNFTWNINSDTIIKLGVNKPKRDQNSLFITSRVGEGRIWSSSQEIEPGDDVRIELEIKAPANRIDRTEEYLPVIDGLGWAEGPAIKVSIDNKIDEAVTGQTPTFSGQSYSGGAKQSLVRRRSYASIIAPEIPVGVDANLVRIHLSYFEIDKTDVAVNSNYKLLVDGKMKRFIRAYDRLKISKDGSKVTATLNGSNYTGSVIRLVPENMRFGIFTLLDYENRPGWNQELNDNEFRGTAEWRIDDGKLITIDELPLGYYLRGIAEVSNGSQPEVIKTLMILARTYAVHYIKPENTKFAGKPYDLDDSPARTQKYLGYGFEKRSPNVPQQAKDVVNKVVTYNGNTVITPYFSKTEGRTKSAKEVWGWDFAPYLQSVDDKYCESAGPGTQAGHGVGLSGCGAAGMAAAGFDHEAIIKYFYQGVELQTR